MKRLRHLLFLLLALEAVYVLAVLVFFGTPLGRRAIQGPPGRSWSLVWDWGWSVIPGRVQLAGVAFDRTGRRADVRVTARRLALAFSLPALAGRRFAADGVTVSGLEVTIVRRPEGGEAAGAATVQRRRPPAMGKAPWRVELRGIEAGVESFAFDDFLVRGGRGRLAGDVAFEVGGEVAAERLELDWRGAAARRGDAVLAEPLAMTFDGIVSAFDPGDEKGWAVLDHLGGRITVEGAVSRFAILGRLFEEAAWIEALDGRGNLRAVLEVEAGSLAPGSELAARAEDLRFDFLGYAAEGSGTVHGSVEGDVSDGSMTDRLARLEVLFDDYALRRKPAVVPHVRGAGLQVVATTAEADLRHGLRDLNVVIDMPRAEVPDMAVYGAFLPPALGFAVASGRGAMSLHLEASAAEKSAVGRLDLRAAKVGGRFGDLGFEAGLELSTRIRGGDLDKLRLDLVGTRLAIRDGVFRDGRNTAEKGWWMTIDVPRGTLHLGQEPRITAEVDVRMKDTRALMALFAEVEDWAERFERILTVTDVSAHGRLAMERHRLSLRGLEIAGRKLQGKAELDLGDRRREGIVYLRYRGVAVGLELAGEERDWKLTRVARWYERKAAKWAAGRP